MQQWYDYDVKGLSISLIDIRDIRGSSHALWSRATLHISHIYYLIYFKKIDI